jgi:hypothetical protein
MVLLLPVAEAAVELFLGFGRRGFRPRPFKTNIVNRWF